MFLQPFANQPQHIHFVELRLRLVVRLPVTISSQQRRRSNNFVLYFLVFNQNVKQLNRLRQIELLIFDC
jgi:hypothetical protein